MTASRAPLPPSRSLSVGALLPLLVLPCRTAVKMSTVASSWSLLISLELLTPRETRLSWNSLEFSHLSELSPVLTHTGLLTHMPALSPTNPTRCPWGLATVSFLPVPWMHHHLCYSVLMSALSSACLALSSCFYQPKSIFSIKSFRICQGPTICCYFTDYCLYFYDNIPQTSVIQMLLCNFHHILLPLRMHWSAQPQDAAITKGWNLDGSAKLCFSLTHTSPGQLSREKRRQR